MRFRLAPIVVDCQPATDGDTDVSYCDLPFRRIEPPPISNSQRHFGRGVRKSLSYRSNAETASSCAADDFESAVAWMLWGLGFAPVGFGMNAKTRDAFDILAVTPRGDFLVVECTLGLLRAESKLSKLSAREASLRKMLATSGLQRIRVLPVIVTAMTREEIKADLSAAAETGVLVLSREDLEAVFQDERLRFANADQIFEQVLQKLVGCR